MRKPKLFIFSGAGLSADSGVPTFRTNTASGKSMWGNGENQFDVDVVCNISTFHENFDLVHEFYNGRRQELANVEPNRAHKAIAELYWEFPGQVINVTTNVDDLLERAGINDGDVIHLHGKITEINLGSSGKHGDTIHTFDIGYERFPYEDGQWERELPNGSTESFKYAKPNVVFFGEAAPLYAEMERIIDSIHVDDTVIVVGCSNIVIPFDMYVAPVCSWRNALSIEINPEADYETSPFHNVYRCGAVDAFRKTEFIRNLRNRLSEKPYHN
jgi:NAD-dependent deacetylase